jgi:type I restriction enzyme S subunit
MRDGWLKTNIGSVLHIQQGKTLAISKLTGGKYPVYGANGIVGHFDEFNFDFPVTGLGCRGSCGTIYYIENKAFLANNVMAIWEKDAGEVDSKFIPLALSNVDLVASGAISGQVQPQITRQGLEPVAITIPTLPEQKRIVDLISSVDSYIESIQLKLECAVESRNAILHELLTADGDDWIETTLGDVVTVVNGGTPSTKNEKYWGGEVLWVTTTELTAFDGQRIDSSKRTITQDGLNSGPARMVRQGTTLVGTTATIGTCAIAACNLTFNQQISGLIPESNQLQDEYLFYWIQLIKPVLVGLSAGTSFKRISTSVLKTISIKYPPLPKQVKIVDFIESLDEVVSECKGVMHKAKLLRSALLADLLSGEHEIPASYDKFIGAA